MLFKPVILLDAIFLVHLCQAMKVIEIWVIQVWTGSFEELKKTQELQLQGDNKSLLDMTILLISISLSQIIHGTYGVIRCMFELCSPK